MSSLQMPASLERLRSQGSDFWQQRQPRERRILSVGAAILVVLLGWLVLLDPALSGIARFEKLLPALRQDAAELQSLANQTSQLATAGRQSAAAVAPVNRESIEAALVRLNLKAQNLQVSGELVRITLSKVSFAALVNLQDELQRSQRVVLQEASFEVLDAIDTVNATLTLRQQLAAQ